MRSLGIVNILSEFSESCGTGFFASPNGYILTCDHVLRKGGYIELGERVFFKYANDSSVYEAVWIKRNVEEDLAILYTEEKSTAYLPLFIHDTTGVLADTYGFPSGSEIDVKTTVSIDRISDDGKRIQLGNANTVTFGFSGAPLIYNDLVIGMISYVAETDSNGHMNELAFAISSKCVLQSFSKYVFYKETCVGYGSKRDKCSNFALSKNDIFCKECFTEEFMDTVKALYKAQNYIIHECKGFFIGELQYGLFKYFNAIFCIVKFDETVTIKDLYMAVNLSEESKYNISHIIIITNANLDEESLSFVQKKEIQVLTREKLLHTLFDFESYRKDLLKYVESEQLSAHYIEVYGTTELLGDSNNEDYTYDNEEHLEFAYEGLDSRNDLGLFENTVQLNEEVLEKDPMLLKDYVDNFLLSNNKALLILGDYGSGKTSFCYTYVLNLLDRFIQLKSDFLPLLIKLRGYNKAVGIGQLLTDYFVNELGINNFNISSLKLLLKNIKVVMIFDGYDEVAKKVDFDVKYEVLKEICSMVESNTKLIITCRPNYFQNASEFERIFQNSHFAYEPGEKPLPQFIENSIAELNDEQINFYIDSYENELKNSNISIADILNAISNTHDLTDLAKRPFLLYMILKTLPEILREKGESQPEKINAARLYSKYTDDWIKREDGKNKTLIKQEDKEMFCKEFAFELYISNSKSLSYKEFPETIKSYFKDIERIEDIDYFTHDIQSCSFLTSDRTGDFRFIHKSFMEYFVADRVICKLLECIKKIKKRTNQEMAELNSIIGKVYLSMEICLFIIDILELFENNLLKDVSIYYRNLNLIARSNLLSIIAKSNTNMIDIFAEYKIKDKEISHVDFSNSRFVGGVLDNLSFENIQFFSVNFEGTTFNNCNFNGVVFNKTMMTNVKFCECSFCSTQWKDTKLINCIFYTNSILFLECYDDTTTIEFDIEEQFDFGLNRLSEVSLQESHLICDLDFSTWESSSIMHCLFYECVLSNSKMISMSIHNSTFICVDFTLMRSMGQRDYRNNKLIEVMGSPYDLEG